MAFILKRAQSGLGHIGDAVEGVSRAHRRVFSTDLRNASSSPPPLPVSAGKPVLDGPVRKRFVASLWWEKKWAMGELLLTATSFFFVGKAHEPFSMQVRADDIVWVRKKKSVWIVPMIKIRTKMCSKSVVFRVDNKLLAFQALEQLWKGQETADLERQAANAAAEKEMKAAMKQIAARYDLVQLLGHGSFGSTFIVQDKEDLRQYVLKRVTCKNQEDVYAAMREMLILKLLKHPYIVAYRNFWQDNLDIYIVMEYCEGGDLEAMKKQHALAATTFTESEILRWFSQVALAIDYMHDHNIIHRDIKPLNIFVSRWNGAKLGDFGLSVSREGTSKDDAVAGTFAYLAPEILNQKKAPSPKSDVYALGCSLYELLTLRTAYDDKQTGLFPQPLPDAFSKDLRDLVMQMIHEDPDRRPSVKHILKNHLVQDTLPAIKVESEMFSELQQRDDEIQLLLLKLRILRSKAGLQGNSLLDIPITTMEEELASALLSDDDGLAIVANASTGPGSQPQPMPHTTSAPPEMLVVPPAAVAPPPSSGSPRLQSLPRQSSASGIVPKLIPPKHRRTPSSSTSASPGAGAAPLGTSGGSLTSSMEEKDFAAASAAPDVTRNPIEAFLSVHWPLLIPASLPATGSFLSMVSAFLTAVVLYNHQGKLLSFVALLLASLPSVALAAFFTNTPHYIYSAILLVAVGCVPALAGVLTTPTKRAEIGTTSCVLSSALSLVYLLRLHTLLAGVLVTAAFAAALFLSPIVVPKISALSKRFGSCCTPLEVQQAATALWLQCAAYAILLVVSLIYPLVAWSSVPLLLLSLASMFTAVRVLNSPSATVYRAAFPYLLGGSVALLAACRLYGELEAQAAHM